MTLEDRAKEIAAFALERFVCLDALRSEVYDLALKHLKEATEASATEVATAVAEAIAQGLKRQW